MSDRREVLRFRSRTLRPPAWCEKYMRATFQDKGRGPDVFDCWGLVRWILAHEFGKSVPDYADAYAHAKDQVSVARAVEAGLANGWQRVGTAQPGDIVIIRIAGRPWHCAIAVGGSWMLHALEGAGVVAERFDSILWRRRIEGFYRNV